MGGAKAKVKTNFKDLKRREKRATGHRNPGIFSEQKGKINRTIEI